MKLIVNGSETDVPSPLSVADLLAHLQVKMPDMVSVELNGEMLARSDYGATGLKAGDQLEFLYFMGGGARGRGGVA